MSVFRTIAAVAVCVTLVACTTTDVPQGVGFGPPSGSAALAANPTSALSATGRASTTAYDDGFIYGQLTRTTQAGAELATLDRIRFHRIFEIRSAEEGAALFARRVSEMTGCQVTDVFSRGSNYVLDSMTAYLFCS